MFFFFSVPLFDMLSSAVLSLFFFFVRIHNQSICFYFGVPLVYRQNGCIGRRRRLRSSRSSGRRPGRHLARFLRSLPASDHNNESDLKTKAVVAFHRGYFKTQVRRQSSRPCRVSDVCLYIHLSLERKKGCSHTAKQYRDSPPRRKVSATVTRIVLMKPAASSTLLSATVRPRNCA